MKGKSSTRGLSSKLMFSNTELQERTAQLNTKLRFGRLDLALREAYKLRLYLQLSGVNAPMVARELDRVEKVIAELEGNQGGTVQKWVDKVVTTVRASMNPHKEESGVTLLDRFSEEQEEDDKATAEQSGEQEP